MFSFVAPFMLKNVLVPAGGYGSRLGGFRNPYQCKPLVLAHDGRTLMEHTLRAIAFSEIAERVIIVTRPELMGTMQSIARRVGLPYELFDNPGSGGVKSYPLLFEDELQDSPFMLVCGNAPPDPHKLRAMITTRRTQYDQVVSSYADDPEIRRPKIEVQTDGSRRVTRLIDQGDDTRHLGTRMRFLESPFLLTPDIIRCVREDGVRHWLGHHFKGQMSCGIDFYGVQVEGPPEPDTQEDLGRTLEFVARTSRELTL